MAVNAGGESPPSASGEAVFSAVAGTVFLDSNHDGQYQTNEDGLPGVTVFADVNDNGRLDPTDIMTTTDVSGAYMLGGLPAGEYVIREILPAGYARTTPATNSIPIGTIAAQTVAGPSFGDIRISSVPMDFKYLLTLAQHFGQQGTFATGDVNGDDLVNFADLLLVAQNYNHTLGAAAIDNPSALLGGSIKLRRKV